MSHRLHSPFLDWLVLAIVGLLTVGARDSFADACPSDQAREGNFAIPPQDSTIWGVTWGEAGPGRASADHRLGTGSVSAWSACSAVYGVGGQVGEVRLAYIDDFTLVGPGSSPVALTATASVHFVMGPGMYCYMDMDVGPRCIPGYGTAAAGLTCGAEHDSVAWSVYPYLTQDSELHVAVSAVPGVPFRVVVSEHVRSICDAFENAPTTASHVLRFDGLPPGYSVVACKSAGTVPVRPTTWGRLKAIYR